MRIEIKIFEIRDRATFMPMFAFTTNADSNGQHYLLRRAGFGPGSDLVMFGYLDGRGKALYDPYDWNDRTKQTAHAYIQKHWDELKDGDVIDVEFILGETKEPKISERLETYE